MDRRSFLKNLMSLAGGGLVFAGAADYLLQGFQVPPGHGVQSSSTSTTSSQNFLPDYQDFLSWLRSASGSLQQKSVKVSLESEFTPLSIQRRSGDFLSFSGVNDQYSIKPYISQLAEVNLMIRTQSPTYDLFSVDIQNVGGFKDAVVSPLTLAEKYPALTYPRLNIDEFTRAVWDRVATYPPDLSLGSGGSTPPTVPLFPLDMPLMVLFYRSDVYSQLGMTPPRTWDEYFDDVVALKKSQRTPFATVNMAAPDISVVYEFANHVASFGGSLWKIDGNNITPTINSDAVLAALENLVRFKPYSDPASYTYSWGDVFNSLAFGNAATGLLWHDYTNWISDPLRSRVSGKIATSQNPAGPQGSYSTFGGAGVGVSRYSNNPEAAWLWLQWATAKGTQEMLLLDQYHVYPTRQSVFDVPDVSNELAGDTYAAVNLARRIWSAGNITALLGFPKWHLVLNALPFHLNKAWTGAETPKQALDAVQNYVEALGALTY